MLLFCLFLRRKLWIANNELFESEDVDEIAVVGYALLPNNASRIFIDLYTV